MTIVHDRQEIFEHVKFVDEVLRNGNYELVDNMLIEMELNSAIIAVHLWNITRWEKQKFKNRDAFQERCLEFFSPKMGVERTQKLFGPKL
jgi:glycerol-3-phosphate cytidylyltransferase-like family protein